MWGVYPEARNWNVGALCLYFSLDEQNSPRAPNWPFFLKVPNIMLWGIFIKIHSPNLKSEHRDPKCKSLDIHPTCLHMFRRCEIFTFQWLGPVLRSITCPLKLLGAIFFYKLSLIYIANGIKKHRFLKTL